MKNLMIITVILTAAMAAHAAGREGKPMKEQLKALLSPEQYSVICENGTERPFANEYWNNHKAGLYVDRVSGEVLFSSLDKFDSGTGWPSFTRPVQPDTIVEKADTSHGMKRVEVRGKKADSHLGHVFPDGPGPTGLRYCINSASLRFIPAENLQKEGYGQYAAMFETARAPKKPTETAVFAGGCFWGVEAYFQRVKGVISTDVGYTGGVVKNPTYREVCSGRTGHAEAIKVVFDPSVVGFERLLYHFFRLHDPTQLNRQGNDVGTQYRSAIFFESPAQKAAAEKYIEGLKKAKTYPRAIVTKLEPAGEFYPAEEYHQDYLKKNPGGYCHVDLNNIE